MFLELDDRASLLLILALLYAVEGFVWVSRATVLFHWTPFSRCAVIRFGSLIPSENGGAFFLGHWPGSYAFTGQQWPVSVSPVGVFAYVATSVGDERSTNQTERYLAWTEIRSIRSLDCEVFLNDQPIAVVCSPSVAELVARELQYIADYDGEREHCIRLVLDRFLSISEARDRVLAFNRAVRPLIGLSLAMWLTAFVLAPVAFWWIPPLPYSTTICWGLALQFILLHLTVIVSYRSAVQQMKTVLPDNRRIKDHSWSLFVSPAATMWVADRLSRDCLADLHPLAIAAASCSPETFRDFARKILRDVSQPILPVCPACELGAAHTEHWFRDQLQSAIEQAIADADQQPAELFLPPHQEPDTRSYCPRCERQYVLSRGTCHVCGGIELEPFSSKTEATGTR